MSNSSKDFLPYGCQNITKSDLAAVQEVLCSPFLTQGPVVPAFEQAVASKVGANHGIAVNSATSALHIACLALGLGPGDRLWTSPISFVASANCGRYCGADIDFVDIDPATGLISIEALAQKLKQSQCEGTLPKVVVPVHLAGSSCDMAAIGSLAEDYKFSVIEDASHAIGGSYFNEPVGNCRNSAITVFSFHPVKIITTGEGGMATTNNSELAQYMADLRSHGITKDSSRFLQPSPGPWGYEQQILGFNYRMTDIQAALGLSQLQRLDDIVIERNRQLKYYENLLSALPVKLLGIPENVHSSVHLAVVLLKNINSCQHRHIFNDLRSSAIGVQVHYSPIHLQPYYKKLGFVEGQFPEAELYGRSAISLPLFPGLAKHDQERVVIALENSLKENGVM